MTTSTSSMKRFASLALMAAAAHAAPAHAGSLSSFAWGYALGSAFSSDGSGSRNDVQGKQVPGLPHARYVKTVSTTGLVRLINVARVRDIDDQGVIEFVDKLHMDVSDSDPAHTAATLTALREALTAARTGTEPGDHRTLGPQWMKFGKSMLNVNGVDAIVAEPLRFKKLNDGVVERMGSDSPFVMDSKGSLVYETPGTDLYAVTANPGHVAWNADSGSSASLSYDTRQLADQPGDFRQGWTPDYNSAYKTSLVTNAEAAQVLDDNWRWLNAQGLVINPASGNTPVHVAAQVSPVDLLTQTAGGPPSSRRSGPR